MAEPIEDEYTGTFLEAGQPHALGRRGAAVPPHPPRRGRRQRPRPHLEPAGLPLVARAHAAVRRHPRRPGEALLDRQGRARQHAAVRQPHGPDAHDLDRQGAQGHRPEQDRVHPVPDRLRRGRRGRARPTRPTRDARRCRTTSRSRSTRPRRQSEFGTVADPNAAPPAEAPAEEVPAEEPAPAETAPAPTAEALPPDVTARRRRDALLRGAHARRPVGHPGRIVIRGIRGL